MLCNILYTISVVDVDRIINIEAMIDESVILYKEASVDNSALKAFCVVGDFSRVRNSKLEENCRIDRQNFLLNVEMGKRTYTGPWNMIFYAKIGAYCSISYGVTIGAPEHNYRRMSTHPFIYDSKFGVAHEDTNIRNERFAKPVEIGNDVWIGANCTILRGVKIGDEAVIAANAVVTKDVPPYAIVAGVPAKVLKFRFCHELVAKLQELQWWNWDDERLKRNVDILKSEVTLEKLNRII